MSEKKKAPTSAATLTGAVETGTPAKMATTSTSKHTTSPAENQPFRIADLLHPGAENAIPRRDLMSLTGLSDRELRLKIEAGRRYGTPILSDCVSGYFLPGDQSELDRCVRSLRRRAGEIMETAAAIERGGDEV
ncbi:MAG: hypothetical protein K2P20_06530 [Oscillospiraceae bacterium]|nr:hypothetical protein [Oscillospiraceae bacterium]